MICPTAPVTPIIPTVAIASFSPNKLQEANPLHNPPALDYALFNIR